MSAGFVHKTSVEVEQDWDTTTITIQVDGVGTVYVIEVSTDYVTGTVTTNVFDACNDKTVDQNEHERV